MVFKIGYNIFSKKKTNLTIHIHPPLQNPNPSTKVEETTKKEADRRIICDFEERKIPQVHTASGNETMSAQKKMNDEIDSSSSNRKNGDALKHLLNHKIIQLK